MAHRYGSTGKPQVTFAPDGVWIYDGQHTPYRFTSHPLDLISVMVYHKDLDLTQTRFRVIGRDANSRFIGDLA